MVAVTSDVVFTTVPSAAVPGMVSDVVMVQDAPLASATPDTLNVSVPVPLNEPPQLLDRTLSMIVPDSMASKLSLNAMALAARVASSFVSVNSSVTAPPGETGPSVNDFVSVIRLLWTSRVAVAGSAVIAPPMFAERELVTLAYDPSGALAGTSTSTSMIQV